MPKIKEVDGWIEDESKPSTNVPKICPKCGRKLSYTNGLQTCGIIFVYCMNLRCRWCTEYEE